MGSPVQLGDAIALLTQIYQAYDIYRSTPDKLRHALKKFEYAENECENLNRVLAKSRRKEYRSYPGTEQLVADLKKAKDFFEQFKPLTEDGQIKMTAKVKKTVSAKWNWAEVDKHVARVDLHRDNMKDFKQTVLIQAAQDNIELQLNHMRLSFGSRAQDSQLVERSSDIEVSSVSSDQMSILSRAQNSLRVAQRLESEPTVRAQPYRSHATIINGTPVNNNTIEDSEDLRLRFATFIEQTGLYDPRSSELVKVQDLEYIAQLPKRWLRQQQGYGRPHSPTIRASMSVADVLPLHEDSRAAELVYSVRGAKQESTPVGLDPSETTLNVRGNVNTNYESLQSRVELPPPELEFDRITFSDTVSVPSTEYEEDQLIVEEPIMIITPLTGHRPIACRLKLVKSEGSLNLKSTTIKSFSQQSITALSDRLGISPSLSPHVNHTFEAAHLSESSPIVLNHAVLGGMNSFPKILHPRAEVGMTGAEGYKYVIEFYQHQYIQIEGYSKLPKAVRGLAYMFKTREDRDLVREKVFGKRLLASAGISTIQFDTNSKSLPTPCGTQAATVWKKSNSPRGGGDITVTIQCSTQGKRTEPDCVVEFSVLNVDAKSIEKVRQNGEKELKLDLRPLVVESQIQAAAVEEGVLSSNASGVSNFSNRSNSFTEYSPTIDPRRTSLFSRRRTSSTTSTNSPTLMAPFRCYLKFSEGSDSMLRAKERFLKALETNFRK